MQENYKPDLREIQCKHCGKKFTALPIRKYCHICERKIKEGKIRICDRCGKTWEGECGFAFDVYDTGNVWELCEKCVAWLNLVTA